MSKLYCALDTADLARAEALAAALGGAIDGIKLGLEFFGAHGPRGVERLTSPERPVFLDLKLHDIPNTVAGAVRALLPLEPAGANTRIALFRCLREQAAGGHEGGYDECTDFHDHIS